MATPPGVVLDGTGRVSYSLHHPARAGAGHQGHHRRVQLVRRPHTCTVPEYLKEKQTITPRTNPGTAPAIAGQPADRRAGTATMEESLVTAVAQAVSAGDPVAITTVVSASPQHRHTILHEVISQALSQRNLKFLSHFVDLSGRDNVDPDGKIPFHDVFRLCRKWSEVATLIYFAAKHQGALLRLQDPCGRTPLQVALLQGDARLVAAILAAEPGIVNLINASGQTALHMAVVSGCVGVECVEELLAAGADPGVRTARDKRTPLLEAAQVGNLAILQLLLQKRVDVNTLDRAGFSPLHHAISGGHVHCVRALLDAGASLDDTTEVDSNSDNTNETDGNRRTPSLIVAVKGGFVDVVRMLLEHGCRLAQNDRAPGWSALHYAVTESPEPSCLDVLLAATCSTSEVNALTDDGRTALMLAVSFGQCDMVSRLLKHPHCDVNVTDARSRMSSLHRATDAGCHMCTSLLLSAGALPNTPDCDGATPLLLAVNSRHTHLIAELLLWAPGRWPWEPLADCEHAVLDIVRKRCYWDIAQYLVIAGWSLSDLHLHFQCKGGMLRLLPQALEEMLRSPPPLKHACRLRFKAKLGLCAPKEISSMSFPTAIRSYLLFDDLASAILHPVEQ